MVLHTHTRVWCTLCMIELRRTIGGQRKYKVVPEQNDFSASPGALGEYQELSGDRLQCPGVGSLIVPLKKRGYAGTFSHRDVAGNWRLGHKVDPVYLITPRFEGLRLSYQSYIIAA
jgi:hypothetical protein